MSDHRRDVPGTDSVLADARLAGALQRLGRGLVKRAVHAAQQQARDGRIAAADVADVALALLPDAATSLRRVLNATGVVLHTNLGRAALSDAAIEAMCVAAGPTDVEFDLTSGRRDRRGRGTIEALLERAPGAAAAHVVNNGAAGVALAALALGAGREVIVSRGELVEIGDGFRIPDLVRATGITLVEVGTTNRTHLADYADAIGPDTAFILKVHRSNFRVEGFTAEVGIRDLATLGVPVVGDLGSGLLAPDPLLPGEPDAASWLAQGASVVVTSGDKLLGGPQAGVVLGDEAPVHRMRRHPMARALRVDKLTLAALEATLRGPDTPTRRALHTSAERLAVRCRALAAALADRGVAAQVVAADGVVGGGGAPGLRLPGWAVRLDEHLAPALRLGRPSVVCRVEREHCLLDLRCIDPASDDDVCDAVCAAAAATAEHPCT